MNKEIEEAVNKTFNYLMSLNEEEFKIEINKIENSIFVRNYEEIILRKNIGEE